MENKNFNKLLFESQQQFEKQKQQVKNNKSKKMNQDIDTFENFTDLDFEKFENDYLQNQKGYDLDIDDELESLNESENVFKPKLSAKKQLGDYKYCTLNGEDYLLIKEIGPTYKYRYVVKLNDWNMKNTISDLFEYEEINNNWWCVELHEDDPYNNTPEVLYLLENFDSLLK